MRLPGGADPQTSLSSQGVEYPASRYVSVCGHPCGCVGPSYQLQGAPIAPQALPSSLLPPRTLPVPGLAFTKGGLGSGWSLPPGPSVAPCRACSRKPKCINQECVCCSLGRQLCLLLRAKKQSLETLYTSGDELKRGGVERRQ